MTIVAAGAFQMGIRVERTGNVFSMASSEFRVTYPDGHVGILWSPPWHELDDAEEDAAALLAAHKLFDTNTHRDAKAKVRVDGD